MSTTTRSSSSPAMGLVTAPSGQAGRNVPFSNGVRLSRHLPTEEIFPAQFRRSPFAVALPSSQRHLELKDMGWSVSPRSLAFAPSLNGEPLTIREPASGRRDWLPFKKRCSKYAAFVPDARPRGFLASLRPDTA